MAFAMKLAAAVVEPSLCPYLSEEAKQALEAAARPPMQTVTVGTGERKFDIGAETVMFRHDKRFVNRPGLMVRIKDTESPEKVSQLVDEIAFYKVGIVGMEFWLDGFAIQNESGDAATFIKCIELVKSKGDLPLVLIATDPAVMKAALEKVGSDKPVIYAATKDNRDKMTGLAKDFGCPLAVQASDGLNELAELVEEINKAGMENLILDPGARQPIESLVTLTQMRRLALKKAFRPFGYPVITFPGEAASSLEEEVLLAGQHIAKYGGIIVLDQFSPAMAYNLLTLRLNIYTDPQKPIEMEPGIYALGNATPESPACTTTNFSLSYFSIAGELENIGAWLLVVYSEGLSVLTAWSAGKYDAERIAKAAKEFGLADKVSHKALILPGKVAILKGELEEELPEWRIMVGPPEAMDVSGYLRQYWPPA
jgi:acetyl-CoA decarbonylase/synthase complex subunit gamma